MVGHSGGSVMNLDGERTQDRGKDKSAIGRACNDRLGKRR
jgi:hypothetical protein